MLAVGLCSSYQWLHWAFSQFLPLTIYVNWQWLSVIQECHRYRAHIVTPKWWQHRAHQILNYTHTHRLHKKYVPFSIISYTRYTYGYLLNSPNVAGLQIPVAISTLPLCLCIYHCSTASWTQVGIHHLLSIFKTCISTILCRVTIILSLSVVQCESILLLTLHKQGRNSGRDTSLVAGPLSLLSSFCPTEDLHASTTI